MSLTTGKHPATDRLLILTAVLILAVARGASLFAALPDKACLECHVAPEKAAATPQVDTALIGSSAHKALKCVDCHMDLEGLPHAAPLKPVGCLSCHGERLDNRGQTIEKYRDSVHGRAKEMKMGEDAATCVDCHGKHGILGHLDPQSLVYRGNIPRTCSRCHENNQVVIKHDIRMERPYLEYEQSVHGKALLKDGLLQVAAICTDCHGVHDIQSHTAERPMASQPQTCGKCHIAVYETYHSSIHGRLHIDENNLDSPGCTDCHGEHGIQSPTTAGAPTSAANIPKTCSSCHADATRMAKYDIESDRLSTYKQSFHGVAQGLGSENAANCASCHGYHDVYAPSDPRSMVNPQNMLETCGKCHPKATANFLAGKIHVNPEQKSAGAIYYLRKSLVWLVYATVAFLVFWVGIDLSRRWRKREKTK